jgi:hypothetical protein
MTGEQFLDALKAKIAPATISGMRGTVKLIAISFTDGRTVDVHRAKVREINSAEDLTGYIDKVLSV